MQGLKIRMRALETFRDGNVFPEVVAKGSVVEVDERTAQMAKQSDPDAWEIVGKVIPPPTRSEPEPQATVESDPQVPGDGQEA